MERPDHSTPPPALLSQRMTGRYLAVFLAGAIVLSGFAAAFVEWVGQRTGSTQDFHQIAERQRQDRSLVALPFDLRYWAMLKLKRLNLDQSEIVYISSSRAGEFRERMFRPYSFYNLSFTAWTVDQATAMLDRVTRDKAPRVAIVELDYFMFTDAWRNGNAKNTMYFDAAARYKVQSSLDLIRSVAKQKYALRDCDAPLFTPMSECAASSGKFIGIQSIRSQEGFRWDGSYKYGAGRLQSAEQNTTAEFLIQAMPGAGGIDPGQMEALERLALLARQRGITLIGVQLPLFKDGVDYLDNDVGFRPYAGVWREFGSPEARVKFEKMGIHFFDLSREPFNADKKSFIDAYHPSELGALRSVLSLLEKPEFRSLLPAIDRAGLKQDLETAEASSKAFDIY